MEKPGIMEGCLFSCIDVEALLLYKMVATVPFSICFA